MVRTFLFAGVLFASTALAQHQWQQYTNVRFQYTICYPEDVLKPQPEATNSDGREFTGSRSVTMIAYGSEALQKTLKERAAETASDLTGNAGSITYRKTAPGWFVLSGTHGTSIFYAKTYLSHGQFKSFQITYPADLSSTFNPITAKVSSCFKDLAVR